MDFPRIKWKKSTPMLFDTERVCSTKKKTATGDNRDHQDMDIKNADCVGLRLRLNVILSHMNSYPLDVSCRGSKEGLSRSQATLLQRDRLPASTRGMASHG